MKRKRVYIETEIYENIWNWWVNDYCLVNFDERKHIPKSYFSYVLERLVKQVVRK